MIYYLYLFPAFVLLINPGLMLIIGGVRQMAFPIGKIKRGFLCLLGFLVTFEVLWTGLYYIGNPSYFFDLPFVRVYQLLSGLCLGIYWFVVWRKYTESKWTFYVHLQKCFLVMNIIWLALFFLVREPFALKLQECLEAPSTEYSSGCYSFGINFALSIVFKIILLTSTVLTLIALYSIKKRALTPISSN